MKRLFLVSAGLLLASQVIFSAVLNGTKELGVSVQPDSLILEEFGGWVPGTYIFKNNSKETIEFTVRNAVFVTSDGAWTSDNIGPFPTKITVEPGETYNFDDNILVPVEIVFEMYSMEKLKNGECKFIQKFNYLCGDKEGTVSVKWDVKMPTSPEKMQYLITNTPDYTILAVKSNFTTPESRENLAKFITFTEKIYPQIVKAFGYMPSKEKKAFLRIENWEMFPYFVGPFNGQSFIYIPANLIIYPTEWMNIAFPRELANYFFYSEFPNAPFWMARGLTCYLAGKACAGAGYDKIAQEEAAKYTYGGNQYAVKGKKYLFTDQWEIYNAGDSAMGIGRAYQLMGEIEKLCGSDIFTKLFAKWKQDGFKFSQKMPAIEKTALIIDALAKISGRDVLALFTKFGYQPGK
ncbi:MAG: hypothetical protein HPY53_04525 [Brevinematales bacterium]|nr:hypothetical protein [Brevinematales bacterium]